MIEIDEKTERFLEAAKVMASITLLIGTPSEPTAEYGEDTLHEFIRAYTNMMGLPEFDPSDEQLQAADEIIAGGPGFR